VARVHYYITLLVALKTSSPGLTIKWMLANPEPHRCNDLCGQLHFGSYMGCNQENRCTQAAAGSNHAVTMHELGESQQRQTQPRRNTHILLTTVAYLAHPGLQKNEDRSTMQAAHSVLAQLLTRSAPQPQPQHQHTARLQTPHLTQTPPPQRPPHRSAPPLAAQTPRCPA
jgi:hypothetical protein